MKAWLRMLNSQRPLALTLLRAVMGVLLGYQGQLMVLKQGFAIELFRSHYGMPLPELVGPVVSVLALVGGFALFVGLFTRIFAVLYAIEFFVLTLWAVSMPGMPELGQNFILLAAAVVLATHGAGAFALDRPGQRWEP
ncbi:MAG TPA: DoxX family protein [bacterium]|nr:DoxX family protein [bacterium]